MLKGSGPRRVLTGLLPLFALSLASGCSPIEKQAVRLAAANGCCASLSQADFKALDARKETELKIGETSPTFIFEEGKSYFAAYRLPHDGVARIAFKSTVQDTFIRDTEQVFCPSLLFMDAGKQIIGNETPSLRYSGMRWFGNPYWMGAAAVPAAARYIVIYTRGDAVGHGVSRSVGAAHSETVDANGQKVSVNVDTTVSRTPCGQVGELTVLTQ